MRGGAQAHLLLADDQRWYVVKFRNNPQHRRILINEWVAGTLLSYLKIAAPRQDLILVGDAFLKDHPEVHLTLGTRRVAVEPGRHFGSNYPGDPDRVMVHDYLPDSLLPAVANLHEFRGTFVFDKWLGNADGRQCVFFRANVTEASRPGSRPAFVAQMIDHGFAFNGPHWDFPDSPVQGLYARRLVYDQVRSMDDFQPWLDQMRHFPEEVVDLALKTLPLEWLEGNEDAELEGLLERLMRRRALLPELIEACRDARTTPFPNWTSRR